MDRDLTEFSLFQSEHCVVSGSPLVGKRELYSFVGLFKHVFLSESPDDWSESLLLND